METPNKGELERLREAIFEDGDSDTYPNTTIEKVAYAEYVIVQSLTGLAAAINRISRFHHLLSAGKGDLPKIITHNEAKMTHRHLRNIKSNIDEAFEFIAQVMDESK